MLGLVLQGLAFILIGAGVIVATGLGLAYLIYKSNEHDQARCQCVDCQHRRNRALEKRQREEERKKNRPQSYISPQGTDFVPERDPNDYYSTAELCVDHHVLVKGVVYRVINKRALSDGATKVGLQNILTQIPTMIVIRGNMYNVKIWRKGF